MTFSKFLVAFLVFTNASFAISNVNLAQNPPAETYQPGPWQPVARVDLQRPINVTIINQTDIVLDYDLSANINPSPRQITPGETTTLKSIRIPAYLLINRSVSVSELPTYSLNYAVTVDENNLVSVIVTKVDSSSPGYSTLNINRDGAIYIY